jgi:hypothetical protein
LAAATASFAVSAGATSAAQTFTLTNAGNAALPISSVSIAGANAASFVIGTNTCTASLAAGASCTIAVTFAPSAAGSDSATLTVVDSVGTQTSALTGTATAADFAVTASPGTETVTAGASTSFTVDVTSAQGTFSQPVTLTASGLPSGATVAFSPASVTPGAGGAATTMTIDTAALTAANQQRSLDSVLAAPTFALLLLLPIGAQRRSRVRLIGTLALVVAAMALQGCSNGGFALPQRSTVSAQSQTYTVTITGTSGSTTHSTTVLVTVDSASAVALE